MSAARLAAEQAFAPPPPADAATAGPVVVVRKARVPLAPPAAQADADADGGAQARGPRVFRVASATAPAADEPAPAQAAADGLPLPPSRRRRLHAAERRPGPLLQVYQAPSAPRPATDAAAPADPAPQRLQALARQLAGIDPVFDDIRRAQAFRFRDDASDAAWQSLSVAAAEVQGWIQVQLDDDSVPPAALQDELDPPGPARGPSRSSVFQPRRP